jgi:predicted dehydrogenase
MDTKIAIVGSGFGMYGLLPSFNKVEGCKVVSICGSNSERMQNNCKKFNINQYSDWRKMLETEKPDALAVAVTPKHQYDILKYALENEIAVFAEKPLTLSFHTSKDLNDLAKKKELPNVIDYIFPEIPEWHSTKNMIDNESIGKLIKINVDWTFLSYDLSNQIKSWKTDVMQGGGALSFYFSHIFYYLEYFVGKIKNLDCKFFTSNKSLNGGETRIDMTILFKNDCIGNIHLDISCSNKQTHRIEFIGKEGSILLQNNTSNFVDNFELILKTSQETQKVHSEFLLELSDDELEDSRVKTVKPIATRFINWCNNGVATKPDFEDGMRVQELIETAKISALKSGN